MSASTKTYYVWVTANSDALAEAFVSKLIRRGYTVGPLARHLITKSDDCPACVVAIQLSRIPRGADEEKSWNALGVYDEVCDVIKHVKGKFWSVVVSASAESVWNYGNVSVAAEQRERDEEFKALAKKVN